MIRDIFVEEMVNRKRSPWDGLKYVGIILGTVILLALIFYFGLAFLGELGLSLTLFSVIGLGYLDWLLMGRMHIEYEYSATNGDITVDKIIAKRNRKHLLSFSAKDVEKMGRYRAEDYRGKSFEHTFHAEGNSDNPLWYMEIFHKSLGKTLVIFTPSERLLLAIKPFLKRQVSMEAFPKYNIGQ